MVITSKDILPLEIVQKFISTIEENWNDDTMNTKKSIDQLYETTIRLIQRKFKISLSKAILNNAYAIYLEQGLIPFHAFFEQITRTKSVRTISGVFVVAIAQEGRPDVLSKYYVRDYPQYQKDIEDMALTKLPKKLASTIVGNGCNEDCYYCPKQNKENGSDLDISRSYLSSEGTFKLGLMEDFCPFKQTLRRILELEKMGHIPDKHEFIFLGGTYHSYPASYRREYMNKIFYACNVYQMLSRKFNGKYLKEINDWHDLNPFINKISVTEIEKFWDELRPMKTLLQEQIENEDAPCSRVIGVVIETRPDRIGVDSLRELREFGVTRIQLGIQHTDNNILKMVNRKDTVESAINAIKKARDNGFKIDGHLMPDLPSTTIEKDYEMFMRVFAGSELQLDYVKIYICLDVIYTEIRKMKERAVEMMTTGRNAELDELLSLMQSGNFEALNDIAKSEGKEFKDVLVWKPHAEFNYDNFFQLLLKSLTLVPPWTRINRFQRDFPMASTKNNDLGFVSDKLRTNQQQICMDALKACGLKCYDIRCREIGNRFLKDMHSRARLFIRCYRANQGTEFFISIEVPEHNPACVDDAVILGLCRLRIPDWDINKVQDPEFKKRAPQWYLPEFSDNPCSRIRELHVYGDTNAVHSQKEVNSQHKGIGKFLMAVAEEISNTFGLEKLVVISGVGVRNYYKKLGYAINRDISSGQYMSKEIYHENRLPLVLFGEEYSSQSISRTVSNMYIPQKYFPWLHRKVSFSNDLNLHNYKHIPEAQLAILPLDEKVNTNSFENLIFGALVVLIMGIILKYGF